MPGAAGLPAKKKREPKVKLKQLHWIKVADRKVPGTIWEKIKDEEVPLPLDEIEEIFAAKQVKDIKKAAEEAEEEGEEGEGGTRKKKVVILLSANRSQTIGVLLSHLKMPHDEFRKAITSLDVTKLQPNFVSQLLRLLPSDQEVASLQSYTGPKEDLGAAELFFFELLCIPRLKPRLQCFVFILEFNARLHDLSENVEVLSYALHDIKRCDKLIKVIEIVLALGNYLNGQGPKGGAWGFKLEFLTKLADTKTSDNKSTLLHYLVSYIERSHPDLLKFPSELSNVEIGAKVSENMVDEISKFKKEIKFIYEEMNRPYYKSHAKTDPCGAVLEKFYHTAYHDMDVLENNKKEALAMYKELSKKFGEDELKPDEFMTYIHQFSQSFKEADNENKRKKEEEERIKKRREEFVKQMAEKERKAEERRKVRLGSTAQEAKKTAAAAVKSVAAGQAGAVKECERAPGPGAGAGAGAGGEKEGGSSSSSSSAARPLAPRPKNVPPASAQDGSESIADAINGMPKSRRFTIKKNSDASEGNTLLRDHLSQKRPSQVGGAPQDDAEVFDDIPVAPPANAAAPPPPAPPAPRVASKPPSSGPAPPPAPPGSSGLQRISSSASNASNASRTSAQRGETHSASQMNQSLKDFGKFLSPNKKK